MLVCRICGQATDTMWKCIPKFRAGEPVSFGLCAHCMAVALSCAYRVFTRELDNAEHKNNGAIEHKSNDAVKTAVKTAKEKWATVA